jgi:hypothetical protein
MKVNSNLATFFSDVTKLVIDTLIIGLIYINNLTLMNERTAHEQEIMFRIHNTI